MSKIQNIRALEILDSRGRPTIKVWCTFSDGIVGTASVPSGASTGKAESIELRDGDINRYRGLGCENAVEIINNNIHQLLKGKDIKSQEELDFLLREHDGTPNKSRIGANSILGVSLAFSKARAKQMEIPLYEYFASLIDIPITTLPRVAINLFSGGKHAGAQVPVQDVLIVPVKATTIRESLEQTFEIYQVAKELEKEKFNGRGLTADEGGLAPPFRSSEEMLSTAVDAIRLAGFHPGKDIFLAMDVAASHFYENQKYHLGKQYLDGKQMLDKITEWINTFPIISIEDGLAEEDWEHWPLLLERVNEKCIVVGDDLLCTQKDRINRAIQDKAANSLLLKVNQVGTTTEAAQARKMAAANNWQVMISARSGETEDNWLADLAVGWSGNQIKVGSITQSERLSKYNRLLEIEAETRFVLNDCYSHLI